MAFTYVIDPPPRWAPAEVWRRFLAGVERLPQDDDGVRFARAMAERRLAELDRPARPARIDETLLSA